MYGIDSSRLLIGDALIWISVIGTPCTRIAFGFWYQSAHAIDLSLPEREENVAFLGLERLVGGDVAFDILANATSATTFSIENNTSC